MDKELYDMLDRINEIVAFSEINDNKISMFTIQDILKNHRDTVLEEELINKIIDELEKKGVQVLSYSDDEDYDADDNAPGDFIPSDVNITEVHLSVSNIIERLENHEYDLSPSFQRHKDLWSDEQQSRLIESLMLKIPLPAFYFNASAEDNWIVIDGLQRLTTFNNYLLGEKDENGCLRKRRFKGLQYLTDFNNKTFDELPRQYIRRIKETNIIAYNVVKGTPDEIVFNIFRRINTGGVSLNAQEIRQALYSGKCTELLKVLADEEAFKEATQYAIKTERMQDREYVLRFIAFTELDYKTDYKGNIDEFLIKGLKKVNNYSEEEINRVKSNFIRVMNACKDILGRYAFRKYNEEFRRGPINKALYELFSICFNELTDEQIQKIFNKKQEFICEFGKLLNKDDFIIAIKSGDIYSYNKRVDIGKSFIKRFI